MDPCVVMHAIPVQPRAWFLGSAPSTFTSRWRERLIHRVGGLLPVWRGGVGIDRHVASARAVVANGAVFVQMPEGTVNGPAGRLRPFRPGAALIALRTGAPIVPLAIAGTEELYIGDGWRGFCGRRRHERPRGPAEAARMRRRRPRDTSGSRPRPPSPALQAALASGVEAQSPGDGSPARPRRLQRRLTWR
jgi:hypothetical protein